MAPRLEVRRDRRHAGGAVGAAQGGGGQQRQEPGDLGGQPAHELLDGHRPDEDRDQCRQLPMDQRSDADADGGHQPAGQDGPGHVAGDGGGADGDLVALGGGRCQADRGGDEGGDQPEQQSDARCGEELGGQDPGTVGLVEVGVGGSDPAATVILSVIARRLRPSHQPKRNLRDGARVAGQSWFG
jgi:hypothetical protein